jgi:predicted dehydrogenase
VGAVIRVGFIGAGAVATRHAATIARFDDVRVVAVADPVMDRAIGLAGRGATPYASHDVMLEREDLDAVYVCVPPYAHGPPEQAVIEAGLPLFVEKPLAADLATAEGIAARLDGSGLVTATGYHWRALDIFERATELVADRPVWLALGYWLDRVAPPAWWSRRELSGGQTVEQATHVLDLLRCLVGEVTEVNAVAASTRPPSATFDIDEVSTATLRFTSGAVGSIASTSLLTWHDRMGVRLVSAGLTVELTETALVVRTGEGQTRFAAAGDAKARTDREFLDAARGGPDRVRAPYPEALRTHRLACAVARSAADGRRVELEPAGV